MRSSRRQEVQRSALDPDPCPARDGCSGVQSQAVHSFMAACRERGERVAMIPIDVVPAGRCLPDTHLLPSRF